ncbi:KGG domain-containing protein [Dyella sp. BiH032]|uniref:KGG domain-containing protein n=1 Tax=Dyella sp. BiH032 TaxID=3075430 RepID=UPI002893416D|nr:KGG domain-containing protein [Dyella sp. BiH032]WNL44111.1 KGG domain-containing protein [Dyella sp. BiH032]
MTKQKGQGDMSVREAGRLGGEARKEELGPEGYSKLGKQGGEARKQELGPEGYSELGQKGGHRVRELIDKGKSAE